MPILRAALVLSLLLAVSCRAPADEGRGAAPLTGPLARADSLVAAWVDAERVPGAVLLVAREGRVELARAYGWARLHDYGEGQYGAWEGSGGVAGGPRRLDDPVPMTAGTVFDLASVTKVMATTFAVMLLVDDGVLDLDAPVHTVLPDFLGGGKDAITPRHLLTHRSGL
ncbi:MAG TPA: serine hydrolase domain-containing protein, partial [Longimicrobiales bacterium]|nr:serine hydrolase domain-containing protein [Longimicrobiales bacterium]